ncbi:uncharacterized protein EURHEDRAFT_498305 [Aspergillus ruber CBS 135680]|uniref:Tim44-like domain-containing protein n=1 Tax=Aspergillus ruber (strain CBS 135680) TaxID=1388766 RepID=A0A017SIS9_ASPRC|nr:uncharacterized protein EURHEDRAFT_498305 [Aspergillus ruber CBS 135680]EYE96215.1 hypothetical protein EURHEDRAFT_498305 [Aspergillus ruber CBS 135680]
MASSSRLPVGSILSAARPGFHAITITTQTCQCRSFSRSSIAQRAMRGMPQTMAAKQPAQPSMKTRGKEMSKSEMPQDLGLLPGTFVRPLWRDMPSVFQLPRERMQLEWLWIKQAFQNFLGILAYSKWLNKGLPLRLRERRQVGCELYERMYTAYAEGDVATLRKICCTGLANNLTTRVTNRPKDEKVTWSLDKYNRTPATFLTGARVLADRATQIPEIPKSGVRQVVLRITSSQSTGKVKLSTNKRGLVEDAALEVTPAKQRDCTEYIVLQKLMWFGEEQEWRIWGHTTPTTVEDLETPFFAPGLSLSDRMEAMKAMMEGKK